MKKKKVKKKEMKKNTTENHLTGNVKLQKERAQN